MIETMALVLSMLVSLGMVTALTRARAQRARVAPRQNRRVN